MIREEDDLRDLATVVVPIAGALRSTDDPWEPYRLHDVSGRVVPSVSVYLNDLQAAGRAAATQRSYGMDLLRWFRFLLCTSQVGASTSAVARGHDVVPMPASSAYA
ncbi:hypothetical protein [Actinacidiphila oryziradicis]|uniref:Integrase n=1 Tax=Actinacidiphila oryziradicis TaxID=2571141 RepID=A0A4U0RKS5_9ACTN|nr:hypothetical protein [Actinacidiphila oryziradicis]TJZ95876.1 hypothetical protein FCI23_51655 [Actinacidiphila oryziradicis]